MYGFALSHLSNKNYLKMVKFEYDYTFPMTILRKKFLVLTNPVDFYKLIHTLYILGGQKEE